MAAAVDNVEAVFSQASFSQRRTILIDAGKKLHEILTEYNHTEEFEDEERDNVIDRYRVEPYEALLDVEWIEDMIKKDKAI